MLDEERRGLEERNSIPRAKSVDPPEQLGTGSLAEPSAKRGLVVCAHTIIKSAEESSAMRGHTCDKLEVACDLLKFQQGGATPVNKA